jgi:sporulation protein YlmC with PRC-barrel domain
VHEGSELSLREQAELGRLLAAAEGYRVLASDGRQVGLVDHIRYERHSDHPDKIIIRRGHVIRKRRRAVPFDAVQAVNPTDDTVVLRIDSNSVDRSPSA